MLKSKYGQDYKIAAAFVDKITKGDQIRADDSDALQKLSVSVVSCRNTLKEIGYLSKIENPDSLKAIVAKLPYDLKKKWRLKADDISEEKRREIKFDDIVSFVERQARIASHPIFGKLTKERELNINKKPQDPVKNKVQMHNIRQTFATSIHQADEKTDASDNSKVSEGSKTQANSSRVNSKGTFEWAPEHTSNQSCNDVKKRSCLKCESTTHKLDDCEEFKGMSCEDRRKFACSKTLCYNCLIPYHRANKGLFTWK